MHKKRLAEVHVVLYFCLDISGEESTLLRILSK